MCGQSNQNFGSFYARYLGIKFYGDHRNSEGCTASCKLDVDGPNETENSQSPRLLSCTTHVAALTNDVEN